MTEFDPATHRMVPTQRWFEDFTLGERFVIPSRTMTGAVFVWLAEKLRRDTTPRRAMLLFHYSLLYLALLFAALAIDAAF